MDSWFDLLNAFTKEVDSKDDIKIKTALADIKMHNTEYFADLISDYGLEELIEKETERLGV